MRWIASVLWCTLEKVSEVSVHVVSERSYAGEGSEVAGIIMVDWGSVVRDGVEYALLWTPLRPRARCLEAPNTTPMVGSRNSGLVGAPCRWCFIFFYCYPSISNLYEPYPVPSILLEQSLKTGVIKLNVIVNESRIRCIYENKIQCSQYKSAV